MHALVQEYLDRKAKEKDANSLAEKVKLLVSLGLYEKYYPQQNESLADYEAAHLETAWDSKAQQYYVKVPVEVSDEEYEEILQYENVKSTDEKKNNTVSGVFEVIGFIIFFVGFIAGVSLGVVSGRFTFSVAFIYWIAAFISGMLFIGIAEIIKLLEDIKNK